MEKQAEKFVVKGRIFTHELVGLGGARVIAVDKYVGGEQALGEAVTDGKGRYEIEYEWMPEKGDKELPDVQVKVTTTDKEKKVIAVSAVHYNASTTEELDVFVPADKLKRPSEYERITVEMKRHLDGPSIKTEKARKKRRFSDLREDEERQDISYLANKTGWDARMVAMVALAEQFSEGTGIRPEFYYALLRSGLPANEAVLGQTDPETVQALWNQAINEKVIPETLKKEISKSLKRFKTAGANGLLEPSLKIGVSSLDELLTASLGRDPERKRRFAHLYYKNRGDLSGFWRKTRHEFGEETADRLQLDGKLAFLTVNNAPLIARLHLNRSLRSPLDLVRSRLYKREAWKDLLAEDIAIPEEIPGEDVAEKRANYIDYMVNQLKLSYPTAVVAEMVDHDEIPLRVDTDIKNAVYQFLNDHQGRFELGVHPVEHYLKKTNSVLPDQPLTQVRRLQRLYQISPTDNVMTALLNHGLDSAYAVLRYDEAAFVDRFKDDLGGEVTARLTYAKAHQVHHAVLNIATSYLLDRGAPDIYAIPGALRSGRAEEVSNVDDDNDPNGSNVIAYATLEGLFGEMDYCACEHCRSVLSPAAYLVELLQFIDPPDHELDNPLDVLLSWRPDIQHLQLTCENTNTVLPYIDLVNEILEHYVVNNSLEFFQGFNIEDGISTEELLANPQFVNDGAYTLLNQKESVFPLGLPFHQPLETLRRYFNKFEVPLHIAMEGLRRDDRLDVPDWPHTAEYGWRDILLERLLISRQEYAVLTDSTISLQELYGEDPAISEEQLINRLRFDDSLEREVGISNVKIFSRKLGITYEELIEIARTHFINPHSHLIPKLEKLGVGFENIRNFREGSLSAPDFDALLPEGLDPAQYGGDVRRWIHQGYEQIMGLIVLSDPTGSADICSFEQLEFRYALPDFENNRLRGSEFFKLLRFVRLWKRLGWSIQDTDKAITALYLPAQYPTPDDDEATARRKLDEGFKVLIPGIARVKEVMEALDLNPKRDLVRLLTCWSVIDTHGDRSLYRQMFLNPTILKLTDVFEEDGYGNYLRNDSHPRLVLAYTEALRAAFNLTQDELTLILDELGFDDTTPLNLENVCSIFRFGYLARMLKLSVRELLALKTISGIDPFLPLEPVQPALLRFIELAQEIKESPFKISQLMYFLQHEDLTGKASPSEERVLAFARTIRGDLRRIDTEHAVEEDPTGEIARAKMALVYGTDVADSFFGLLNESSQYAVDYHHTGPVLEEDIRTVTDKLTYNDFQKRLQFSGVMTETVKTDLDNAPSATTSFQAAVQALFDAAKNEFQAFFAKFPDLETLYNDYQTSDLPAEQKRLALLADFLPELKRRLKRQQIRQTFCSEVGTELSIANLLLETPELLHAVGYPAQPAINDFLNLETAGASLAYFYGDDTMGAPDGREESETGINYHPTAGADLPANPADPEAEISGVWRWYLEVPDNGFYNFYIEADAGAEVSLSVQGSHVNLILQVDTWVNAEAIELKAGQLYAFEITARRIRDRLVMKWESRGLARESIAVQYQYPDTSIRRFRATYLRLLKALAIGEKLGLTDAEIRYFGTYADYQIHDQGWLNALPVRQPVDASNAQAVLAGFMGLLRYAALREDLKVKDDVLVAIFQDPEATHEEGTSLLELVTGWDQTSLASVYAHFAMSAADLSHLDHFIRVAKAFEIVNTLGIQVATLLEITTNEPVADTVRDLQGALRARYDEDAWLKVIQPINDDLRSRQREALVAFVLHKLSESASTVHIDTPDKLFEYFLIDVQMDPCMKTSRIKQAISTVQLFVQRCLLNLEPRVSSSSINAKRWEQWMKRYRVWEANRKVFLFPENWIEPELRDNKSSFFKDLESELLQSDITEEAAATALVHYLTKLDEVAKLQICGMNCEEKEVANWADNVVHVIGRTSGARRKYYYRRIEGTSWTPWESTGLDIEDNPVLPVVWNDRLFLFWLSVMEGAASDSAPQFSESSGPLASLEVENVTTGAKVSVTASLYWSEYCDGRWQSPKTSDINRQAKLIDLNPGEFNRGKLRLNSSINSGDLTITIEYYGKIYADFDLYNTHSLPVGRSQEPHYPEPRTEMTRSVGKLYVNLLDVRYYVPPHGAVGAWSRMDKVLHSVPHWELWEVVEPRHHVQNVFETPFFFQDRRHVFFVQPLRTLVPIDQHLGFGLVVIYPGPKEPVIPPLVVIPDYKMRGPGLFPFPEDRMQPVPIAPGPLEVFLERDIYIRHAVQTGGTILYKGKLIGPRGSL